MSLANDTQRETALLGGGCFWCLEAVFSRVDGVVHVTPGYAGGSVAAPTYTQVCTNTTGHAEVVQIAFDPARLSYRALLGVFFATHDPTTLDRQGEDVGAQYRSVIFAVDAVQQATAQEVIAELTAARAFSSPIVTRIEAATRFWPAEVEHHDYYAHHPEQPYCRVVVAGKVEKLRAYLGISAFH
ncbi:peptide methionine sulfoxide reductase MsrA [Betaproteobacteria bacterium]|nr:peptide methionine sulfoxide reductase MsrA [Betaproteobacteria bacterium]GHU24207.1 peptide methionine sulfoxide reductase MsrA [Betaproteobacteria bacterium]GHU29606.1 peptide methionine sulfoxide reductase MsrA [Betaproteobacteria bacterium]